MTIELLPPHQQTVKAIYAAICQFDLDGHDWIDVTTVQSLDSEYLCSRCGAKGIERDDWRSEMIHAGI